MSEQSRERILARLAAGSRQASVPPIVKPEPIAARAYNRAEKIEKLKTLMEAMRTEVHVTDTQNWIPKLEEILKSRELKSLVYPPQTAMGERLASYWERGAGGLPQLIPYEKEIEDFKDRLFSIDAGITGTAGAIADPGALILWPSEKEPRLMSLVPSIHIAVLEADRIFSSFLEAMQEGKWSTKMPTNVVLISGPSKTADIEMTLAFGVHGPRELIVLILES